jgi:4-hydroxybenzoate polyprenyltransferase
MTGAPRRLRSADEVALAGAALGPLAVDLDGSLLRTDLLHECLVVLLKAKPWLVLLLPFWLLGGKAAFKRQIARRVELEIASLPVHAELLAWLTAEKAKGRRLALASASDELLVRQFADRFAGLFDLVLGSDGSTNLAGRAKLAALQGHFGEQFCYVGNAAPDLHIWRECRSAVIIGPVARLRRSLPSQVEVVHAFEGRGPRLKDWVKALRLRQWSKNALLFVPLLLSGKYVDAQTDLLAVAGFVVMGLLASGTYLINDLLDLPADRSHASKRSRPLAAGDIPLIQSFIAIPIIAAAAIGLSLLLPPAFWWVALAYLAITLTYSVAIKRAVILDLLTLAFLFTLRIVAGIAVAASNMSAWLLAFAMFFFLSLACIKRYTECSQLAARGLSVAPGRSYVARDSAWLMSMGAAAGLSATLVFFLFLTATDSPVRDYSNPKWLWLICGVLTYWLGRVWLLAGRDEMQDDPVAFAVTDKVSLFLALVCVVLVFLARLM